MKVLKREKDSIKLEPQTLEDLWFVSRLVDEGDEVSASSFRRFKSTDKLRGDSGEKKRVFIRLRLENTEFSEHGNKLRLHGVIVSGTPQEFVQLGEHHTIDVGPRTHLTLHKELSAYNKEILQEALKQSGKVKAALVVLDERHARVAVLTATGVRFSAELSCAASKRDLKRFEEYQKKFFHELADALERMEQDRVIIAGPGFAREEFLKWLKDKRPGLAAKASLEHASTTEKSGVYELLKRGVVERLLGEQKLEKEFKALEELKKRVAKEGLAVYGLSEVEAAVNAGAVETLLVSDELLRKSSPHAAKANELIESSRKLRAGVLIFDSKDDAGKEFKAFGVAALLRYQV